MKPHLFLLWAVLLSCSAIRIAEARQVATTSTVETSPSFSLTIKPPEKPFKIGEEVVLPVVITNTSDHDVYFKRVPGYDSPEFSYYFSILTDIGENKESRYSARIHDPKVSYHGSVAGDILKPGKSLEMKAHLNRIADLDEPGHYNIQISRNDRLAGQVVTSNKVVLEVIAK